MSIVQQTGIKVAINNQARQQIRTVGIPPAPGVNQLRGLTDVDVTNLVDKSLIVYEQANDKFVVGGELVVDGGTF